MIRVTLKDNTTKDIEADSSRVTADGLLEIYKWGSVGRYQCPLQKELKASFKEWKHYAYVQKDSE